MIAVDSDYTVEQQAEAKQTECDAGDVILTRRLMTIRSPVACFDCTVGCCIQRTRYHVAAQMRGKYMKRG